MSSDNNTDNEFIELKPKKVNKTADYNGYMKEYMRNQYNNTNKGSKILLRKNADNIRSKFIIDDEISSKYGDDIFYVVKIKTLLNELPKDKLKIFLAEYQGYKFDKKLKK